MTYDAEKRKEQRHDEMNRADNQWDIELMKTVDNKW